MHTLYHSQAGVFSLSINPQINHFLVVRTGFFNRAVNGLKYIEYNTARDCYPETQFSIRSTTPIVPKSVLTKGSTHRLCPPQPQGISTALLTSVPISLIVFHSMPSSMF